LAVRKNDIAGLIRGFAAITLVYGMARVAVVFGGRTAATAKILLVKAGVAADVGEVVQHWSQGVAMAVQPKACAGVGRIHVRRDEFLCSKVLPQPPNLCRAPNPHMASSDQHHVHSPSTLLSPVFLRTTW
jgi:hypothetical protein